MLADFLIICCVESIWLSVHFLSFNESDITNKNLYTLKYLPIREALRYLIKNPGSKFLVS